MPVHLATRLRLSQTVDLSTSLVRPNRAHITDDSQRMTHDIDQRLEKLLHQAQELAQEKRLFETLARASVDDCIDDD
jgi:hypothetical protein